MCIYGVFRFKKTFFLKKRHLSEFGDLCLYDQFLYIMSLREMDMISLVLIYVDNCFYLRQRYHDASQLAGT